MFQKLVISCCAAVLVAAFVTGYTVSKTTVSDPATASPRNLEPNGPRELPLEYPLTDQQVDYLDDEFGYFEATIGSQEEADRWGDQYGEIEPGVPYRVYLVYGTYEQVFGAYAECGPFIPYLCKSPAAFDLIYAPDIMNAAYAAGIGTNFTLPVGDFGHSENGSHVDEGSMAIYNYHDVKDNLPTNSGLPYKTFIASNVANTTPRLWALPLGHKDYLYADDGGPEYKPSVNVTIDNINYTVTFKYGAFDDLFSSNHNSCSLMFSELCFQGKTTAEKYTEAVINALGDRTTISPNENTDKFHIPFNINGYGIKTVSDASSDLNVDGNCCDTQENVGREYDKRWWASFSPRIGGYPNADSLYCNDEFQKSSKSADSGKSSFDPLERHTFTSGDSDEMDDFNYYYHKLPIGGDDHTFPDQGDVCKNSNYQGALALKVHSNDEEELVSFATQPIVIDLAKYDRPEAFYQRFEEARSAATRSLRLIHSKYDKDNTLPKVKFHYQHDDIDNLYNDKEGLDKHWYLITTPPGENDHYDPKRFGTDDSYEGDYTLGTDPRYCTQLNHTHECNQTPFTSATDHTYTLTAGQNLVYTIQLAEADDYESGEESSISEIARYWYDEEFDQIPSSEGGFYIFTDATGILTTLLGQNEDDLLAASTFEVSHGAAYALAQDFKLNSSNNHLRMCKAQFKMREDYVVQRVRNNDSTSCNEDTKSWILPKFKWATRGTVYTNIWAEIVD